MVEAHGFWAEGQSRHLDALKEAEEEELAALRKRLFFASPAEQAEIKLEMKSIRKKYRDQRQSTDRNLYFGAGSGEPDSEG